MSSASAVQAEDLMDYFLEVRVFLALLDLSATIGSSLFLLSFDVFDAFSDLPADYRTWAELGAPKLSPTEATSAALEFASASSWSSSSFWGSKSMSSYSLGCSTNSL